MKISEKCISLKLAKAIQKAADANDFKLSESEHYWEKWVGHKWIWHLVKGHHDWAENSEGKNCFKAFDCNEVFDILGLNIPLDKITEFGIINICKNNGKISKDTKDIIRSVILEKLDDWIEK